MATNVSGKQVITNNFETADSDKEEIKLIAVVSEERKVNSCLKKSLPLSSKEKCFNTKSDDSNGIDLIIEDVCKEEDTMNSALKKSSANANNKIEKTAEDDDSEDETAENDDSKKETAEDDDSKNEAADSDGIESVIDTICETELPEALQKINSNQKGKNPKKENINSNFSEPDDLDSVIEAIGEDEEESDFELNVSSDSCKENEMANKIDLKTDLTEQDDDIDSAIEAICEEEGVGADSRLSDTSENTGTEKNDFVTKLAEPDNMDSVIEGMCEEEEEVITDAENSISRSDKNAKNKVEQLDLVKGLSELDDSIVDVLCEDDEEQESDSEVNASSNSKNESSESCTKTDLLGLDDNVDEVISDEEEQKSNSEPKSKSLSSEAVDEGKIEDDDSEIRVIELDSVDEVVSDVCEEKQKSKSEPKSKSPSSEAVDESKIENDDSQIRVIELDSVDDKTKCIEMREQNLELNCDFAANSKEQNHVKENELEHNIVEPEDFDAVVEATYDEADVSENCEQGHYLLKAKKANGKENDFDTISTKTPSVIQNEDINLPTNSNRERAVIVKDETDVEINFLLNTLCTEVHEKSHETAEDKNNFNVTSCSSPMLALSTPQQRKDYKSRKLNEGIECLVSYLVKSVSFNTFSQSSFSKTKEVISETSKQSIVNNNSSVKSITSEKKNPTEYSSKLKRRASQCDDSEKKRLKEDCGNVEQCVGNSEINSNIDVGTDESSSLDSNVSSKKRRLSDSEDSGTECIAIKRFAKESLSDLIDTVADDSLSHSSRSSLLKESDSSKLEFPKIKDTPKQLSSPENESLDKKRHEEPFLTKTVSSIDSLSSVSDVQKNLSLSHRLLQTMCQDDSSDSEKSSHASSLKIDESVQNIIQRLSSPKTDSNSVSDIEIDGSNSVAESLKFTTTKFDMNSASIENGNIEKEASVGSDAKKNPDGLNLDGENNDKSKNSELKPTIPAELKTNEPSADVHEDRATNNSKLLTSCLKKVEDSSEAFSESKTEKLSTNDSSVVDGDENDIPLSAKSSEDKPIDKNVTDKENKSYDSDEETVTLTKEQLEKIIVQNLKNCLENSLLGQWINANKISVSDSSAVDEERKRIDQLRSTLRAMIMQQRTFYRNCAYTPKVDTRTVGVNVQILKDGITDTKCLNACPIHCRCALKREPELSSTAISSAIPVTSGANVKIESPEASTCAPTLMKLPSTSISLIKEESTTEPSPPVGKASDRNLIGFPPVAMSSDVTVRSLDPPQETPVSVSQKKTGESSIPQIVDLTEDDDPPKPSEAKVMPPKTITITKINQPSNKTTSPSTNAPVSLLPPLGSMVQVSPPASNTGSPRPDGNIRMVRSGAFMPGSQRLAYLLPSGTSPVFSQVPGNNSRPVAYRSGQTPNGFSNMVILAPILSPNQGGPPRVAVRPTVRQAVPPSHVGNFVSSASQLTLTPRFSKHPAPLPQPPAYPANSNLKALPPKPTLKMNRTVNGIVLSWNMNLHNGYADVTAYQLYAYQENSGRVDSSLWKKVSDIKAMPLPMACTLTQFVEDHKYHFAVRAVDAHRRVGPFSDPVTVQLLSKGGSSKACASNARS